MQSQSGRSQGLLGSTFGRAYKQIKDQFDQPGVLHRTHLPAAGNEHL